MNSTRLVGWLLLALGLTVLAVSIMYESSILAFIGLGLTFWGPLLFYISPEKYIKQTLLDSTITPSLANLDQILSELKYNGNGIYLPPKYLKGFETIKIFIPKDKGTNLPTPEEIQQQEDKIFLKNPEAALISPPGLSLSKLFEKTLGTRFTEVDLEYLQQSLPKLVTEDLEIAEGLEIQKKYNIVSAKITGRVQYDTIHVKMTNSVYKDVCKETGKLSHMRNSIGCPICSAIACALTKAAGKPVIIEEVQMSVDGKTIEANFQLLESIESEEPIEPLRARAHIVEAMKLHFGFYLLNLAGLFLTAFGSIILAWVGWLTWHDVTTWGKDIALIFFGSRTDEVFSLGVGMRVIHYFLMGLALFLSGLFVYISSKRKK